MIVIDQIVSNSTKVKGSSIYKNGLFLASYAVDGNFKQNDAQRCFHTDVNNTIKEAWLRIDLGGVFSVSSVKFWYRNDNDCKYNDIVHSTSLFKSMSMQLI